MAARGTNNRHGIPDDEFTAIREAARAAADQAPPMSEQTIAATEALTGLRAERDAS